MHFQNRIIRKLNVHRSNPTFFSQFVTRASWQNMCSIKAGIYLISCDSKTLSTWLILGFHPANERRRYKLARRKPRISPEVHPDWYHIEKSSSEWVVLWMGVKSCVPPIRQAMETLSHYCPFFKGSIIHPWLFLIGPVMWSFDISRNSCWRNNQIAGYLTLKFLCIVTVMC